MKIDKHMIAFLWWFRLVGFFPKDMQRELVELGTNDGLAYLISRSESVLKGDVVQFLHDWEDEPIVDMYIERYLHRWKA